MMVGGTLVKLRDGDPRCEALETAVLEVIYERGLGLPLPSVIGVLRLVEHRLIEDATA